MKRILATQTPAIDRVALFGSRATGAYQPYSDIDLVIYGAVSESVIDRLWTLFQESYLPYKVDIVAYQQLKSPVLKRHIDELALPLFNHQQLYGDRISASQ